MSNKTTLILVLVAIIGGGYWYSSNQSGSVTGNSSTLLERVPADTVMFFGGLETMPYSNPLNTQNLKELFNIQDGQMDSIKEIVGEIESPAAAMSMNLYLELMDHVYSGNITELNDFAFYTLGIYPVSAWQSKDILAFTSKLDAIEKENSIDSRSFKVGSADLREYLIHEDSPVKMYISINGDVVSIGALSDKENMLQLFSGVDLPKQNLANSDRLKQISSEHKLKPFGLGYFDINIAMKALGSNQENLLKQSLNEISEGKAVEEITTNTCFEDIGKIASGWPKMVFGYRKYDITDASILMDAAIIFENTDSKFLTSLKSVVGTVSDYSFEDDIMSMGIGVNIDNIASFVIDLRKDFLQQDYKCEALIAMQQESEKNDPAMLAMGTQMVAGLKGVSAHITKADIAALTTGDLNAAEGIVVLSAENPKNLLLAASNFYPPLAEISLEANGESQPLALPMGITANISMSESALTLQLGDSEADQNRITQIHNGEGMSPSFFRFGLNMSAYFEMVEKMLSQVFAESSGQDMEQVQKMFELFKSLDMKFVYDFNVEDKGIVILMKISMKNAKQ